MSNLRAAFILTFEDKVTAGLRRLQEQMNALKRAGREMAMPGLQAAVGNAGRLGRAIRTIGEQARFAGAHLRGMLQHATRLGQKVGPIGALVGFGTLKATTQAYADYDAVLRQIAIVEGRSGGGQAARLSARLGGRFDAMALRTGQSSTDIAEAYKWIITTHPGVTAKAARAMANQMIGALATAATAYHLNVTDLKNVPFALQSGFGLSGNQMESGLAILHRAAMQAHFTMGAFDQELAGLAAQFGSLGVTGLSGLRSVAAMLETVVKVVPSATPSMAGTDLGDLLSYVTGPTGQARMAMTSRGFSGKMYAQTRALLARAGITHGFNASSIIRAGALKGVDPVDAVLNYLHAKLLAIPKNITGRDRMTLEGEVVNALISNHQAAQAARAILLHWDEYHRTQKAVGGAGKASLDRNFITMHNSPLMQMQIMGEGVRQLGRALGAGFLPVLKAVNLGLLGLVHFFTWANKSFPKTTAWVLGLAGAGILLVSVLGVLGMVAPAIAVGFELVLDVVALLAGAISAVAGPAIAIAAILAWAAWDIYSHWDRFGPYFHRLFAGVAEYARGFGNVLWGIMQLDPHLMLKGIKQIGEGFKTGWIGELDIIKGLLEDIFRFLGAGPAAIKNFDHALTHPWEALEPAWMKNSPQLNAAHGSPSLAVGAATGVGGVVTVTVGVDPANGKLQVTHVGSSNPSNLRVNPLNMGDMLQFASP